MIEHAFEDNLLYAVNKLLYQPTEISKINGACELLPKLALLTLTVSLKQTKCNHFDIYSDSYVTT